MRMFPKKMELPPSKGGTKGTFTRAAKRHKMGVQQFANYVLANRNKFSPLLRKRANFARNFAH